MKSAAGQYRLRIALAAINPTVGDLAGNSAAVARAAAAAETEGAHLIVFPEMVLTGYPIEDLALRSSFRRASKKAIDALATDLAEQGNGELVAIVGYLDETPDGRPQNVAAVIHGGHVKARYIKTHLPNFGVFDEYRNFVAGDSTLVVRIHGVDVGVLICQDIWHPDGVLTELAKRSPGLVVVPNGSPF
jgi:NAD+ synthase (glutamine-hydrolysing)